MHLDLKPSTKRVPLRVAKRSTAKTQKHKIETWEVKDWREKLRWGTTGVISTPSNDSAFIAMMKGE
jgi:hypothetical protein